MTKTKIRGAWPKAGIDIDKLSICDDPLPSKRTAPVSKYEPLFAKLKFGQAVKCESRDAGRVKAALEKWAESKMLTGYKTKATSRYPKDGKGRVWLLAAED